jgi:hypothetical protein
VLKKIYWFLFVYDLNGQSDVQPYKHADSFKKKLTRDVSVLVLSCYTLLIFGNLAPVFADVLAHTFWEKEHLMTVHQSQGMYHVHFQMVNAEKQSAKDKPSGTSRSNADSVTHLIYSTNYNFSNKYFTIYKYSSAVFSCPVSFGEVNYQPPRV